VKGIVFAGALSLLLSFIFTPTLIRILAKRGVGQMIRDDGPKSHHVKRGTPTMGGIVLILSTIIAYFASHLFTGVGITASAVLVMALIVGLGLIGFLDDWLKISRKQSLGLTAKQKLFGQAVFAAGFAYAGLQFEDESGLAPISMYFSGVRDTSFKLGMFFVILWVIFLVLGSSNGVNLTDGLDGLASGAAIMTFLAFIVIGVWEFGQSCAISDAAQCYNVRDPLDIAVLSAALAGACAGFLWWNAAPAKIFMGDVGSLALGGAISGIAIVLRVEALLAALGGLFVLITLSVIIQTGYFKLSGGKRIFKMAPLQHHFELLGWGEVTIVIRFWILAGMSVAAGLGLFYGQWVVSQ
jgi:phospho-N-acetylmuramoyl-pentapeptide-transferase